MFFSSSEGRKCVYMQIYQSPWKCSKYMVCLCSKYAKINGDVLSIVSVYVLSKGLNNLENNVLSSCPQLYIAHYSTL